MMDTTAQYFQSQFQLRFRWQVALFALLIIGAVISLGFGPAGWDWRLSIAWLVPESFTQFNQLQINVVTQIRLPRFCLALLIGAVLAQTGAATQALCRNPLADPSIIGVSSGAAAVAVTLIALAPKLNFNAEIWLPYGSFLGALAATFLVYRIARQNNEIQVTTLILVGVAINALAFAVIGLMSFYADDSSLRLINYWTMGSLGGATWGTLVTALPLLSISLIGLFLKRKELNLLLLGEAEAKYLGIDIIRLKSQVVVLIAVGVGAAVSLTGLIGFVGLVVPHLVRLLVGANLRMMMPVCVLAGALVVLVSDWLARVVVSPAELPIGIVTALIGGPIFIYLLRRQIGGHHA